MAAVLGGLVEADLGAEQPLCLLDQPGIVTARPAAIGIQSQAPHEFRQAAAEFNVPPLFLDDLGREPEHHQARNRTERIPDKSILLMIPARPEGDLLAAIRACPCRHIAGIGVRQGRLYQLPCHEGSMLGLSPLRVDGGGDLHDALLLRSRLCNLF